MPFTRIEIALFTVRDGELHVLLARRAEEPHAGKWALPGGVLRIYRESEVSLDAAARRVAVERLNLEIGNLRQLCAVGGPDRDPRGWALSVVYRGLVPFERVAPSPGLRVKDLQWRPAREAADDRRLAFDHPGLIARALRALQDDINRMDLPAEFLPDAFTLSELQQICGALRGQPFDKASFRRRVAERVEPVEGEMRGGANRPAQVFRLARFLPADE
jgi:8-oxo-dGTP diphosphatase